MTQVDTVGTMSQVSEPAHSGDALSEPEGETTKSGLERVYEEAAYPRQVGEREEDNLKFFPCEEEEEAAAWMYSDVASELGPGSTQVCCFSLLTCLPAMVASGGETNIYIYICSYTHISICISSLIYTYVNIYRGINIYKLMSTYMQLAP